MLGPTLRQSKDALRQLKGTKREAAIELAKLIAAAAAGTRAEPSKTSVSAYLLAWMDGPHGLAGKTAERYRQLIEAQIIPHLGAIVLQKLKPSHIADWHDKLIAGGGKDGQPLSSRTYVMPTGFYIAPSPVRRRLNWCPAASPAS
jgi:Phage integrase, N-terminal SAM-like domain